MFCCKKYVHVTSRHNILCNFLFIFFMWINKKRKINKMLFFPKYCWSAALREKRHCCVHYSTTLSHTFCQSKQFFINSILTVACATVRRTSAKQHSHSASAVMQMPRDSFPNIPITCTRKKSGGWAGDLYAGATRARWIQSQICIRRRDISAWCAANGAHRRNGRGVGGDGALMSRHRPERGTC